MSDINRVPSLIDNKMATSTNIVIKKEVRKETNDSEEPKENHSIKLTEFSCETTKVTVDKSIEHSEPTNSEISNKTNVSLNESETLMETLDEQLINEDNKSENQIEKDNSMSNKTNFSSNESETLMETLNEQLIDQDNKNENQIEKDNLMSIDNEVITADKSEVNNECPKNKVNNYCLINEMGNLTRTENLETDLYIIDNCSSLQAIAAEYDSSDAENENENKNKNVNSVKVSNSNVYRNIDEVKISDSESSDSESDSSSSESESDSDKNCSKSNSDDSDEETSKKTKGNKSTKTFKPKGEFDDLPPIEDLKISVPEVLCDPLGEVAWTVEQMVVVRPKPGKPTLNLDTVLFIEKGQRALGHIFDVFGQVAEPHYCIRFNSSDHIQECDIKVGMTVYYCPNTPYTSLVFLSELTKMKAIDDIGDDEPPQFSDDEEEQAYLASLKNKQNNRKVQESSSEYPSKRKRGNKTGWQSNHPWNSNKDHHQKPQPHNSKPFYRTHHPWSRARHPPQNQWPHHNFYGNQWMGQYPAYNQMQAYNQFPQAQWDSRFQLPQVNNLPLQGAPPPFAPPFNFPPPPPPPPPSTSK